MSDEVMGHIAVLTIGAAAILTVLALWFEGWREARYWRQRDEHLRRDIAEKIRKGDFE